MTEVPWSDVGIDRKLPLLRYVDEKARAADPSINKVSVSWADADERVSICDSLGTGDKWRNIAKHQIDELVDPSALDDFLTRRQGDRVGLVVFGNAAFVQVPFTEDLDVCRMLLEETGVRMAGPRTAFGDAIGLGITLFEESEVAEHLRHHALFIAYAPFDDPQIAVAVVVDHGGSGTRDAAPIARAVIEAVLAPS